MSDREFIFSKYWFFHIHKSKLFVNLFIVNVVYLYFWIILCLCVGKKNKFSKYSQSLDFFLSIFHINVIIIRMTCTFNHHLRPLINDSSLKTCWFNFIVPTQLIELNSFQCEIGICFIYSDVDWHSSQFPYFRPIEGRNVIQNQQFRIYI